MDKTVVFVRLTEDVKQEKIHPHSREPAMGMLYALSYAQSLHLKSTYFDTALRNESVQSLSQKIISLEPTTVFIDTRTTTVAEALELATAITVELPEVTLIAVGQHVTAIPESLLFEESPFSLGFQGEYEVAIRRYLESGSYHTISSAMHYDVRKQCLKKGELHILTDLDDLGIPAYVPGYYTGYPLRMLKPARWGYVEITRGCPYHCAFCSQTLRISYGKQYRRRSVAIVIDELRALKKQGVNAVRFLDDNFVNDQAYIEELCEAMISHKLSLKWIIQTRTDLITPHLLRLMKKAGCSTICVGIESGSQRILDILKKQAQVRELYEKVKMIQAARIWVVNFFMIGNPTETKKEIERTMNFCRTLQPELIQVAFFTPYPGSEYYTKIPDEEQNKIDYYSHYNKIKYNFSAVESEKLLILQKQFYKQYLFSLFFLLQKAPKLLPSYLLNMRYFAPILLDTVFLFFRK
jgi:anaerobic magnesium-protoporphyrin IX monomethyl ester cyclase